MRSALNRRKFIGISLAAAAGLGGAGLWRLLRGGGEEELFADPQDTVARETESRLENGRPESARPETGQPGPADRDRGELSMPEKEKKEIPRRALGKTGFQVGLFSLGGEAAVEIRGRRDEAVEIIHRALDRGVNYIDTASSYGGGGSEENIGEVMRSHREEAFLASKTHDRTYDGTMRLFEQSLQRLQTDYLDLYQVHNMRVDEDLDRALGKGGALQAMKRLQEEGAVRHLGITGHSNPAILLRGIREYDFDCLLMALNAADLHYLPFQQALLETALEKEMGIIAMKVTARGNIFQEGGITTMQQALGYVFSLPISTAIVGISRVEEIEENAALAAEFTPFSREKMAHLESLVAPYQEEANFFKYHW